jgi:hypothetical protein
MRSVTLTLLLVSAAPWVRAADGDSVDSAVRAVYETISGPAGTRDWDRFRSLFADGARLISIRVTAGVPSTVVMTPEDYIKSRGPILEKNPFYESELSKRVESFGAIAHVFSTYESRRAPRDKPFARGINSFQLVNDGKLWKVMTVLWDTEREGNPIPEKYLKPQSGSHVAQGAGTGMVVSAQPSFD